MFYTIKLILVSIAVSLSIVLLFNLAYAGNNSGKSAVSGSQSAAGASINYDDHSKNNVIDRNLAPSSGNVTAHTQGRFTEIKGADVSYRPAHEFVQFGAVWSEGSLEVAAAGGDVKSNFSVVNDYDKPSNISPDGNRYILILTGNHDFKSGSFKMSAPFDAEADDTDTNSFQVIAAMALKALRNGDNVILITFEGFNDKIYASGWGIGTHVVGSTVNDAGKVAGTGGGGFGISKNHSGEERLPWIKGYSGCFTVEIHGDVTGIKISKKKQSSPIKDSEGGR